ncbi:RTA1 like protein-domain-containing protein [Phyllosticta capitalensis]|uniref:RTA1 like protein-domain-containing protein n=1 Tax=Phyllosticta capitalensis TaxID=121624 RepID=A0ABR1Z0V5_9PEZI
MSDSCTVDTCPIKASTLGYRPNVFSSIFFISLYGTAALVQAIQGYRWRTWSFTIAMVLGCLCEAGGYPGRLMLHHDWFSKAGFDLQIVCLTIAPAFLSAGIYFMLKHLVLAYSPSSSRLAPHWYPKIFIPCDFVSLVLQAAGGGIAATADDDDKDMMDTGNNIMMAGLGFQVFTLAIFAVLAGEFAWRVRRADVSALNEKTSALRGSTKHKLFLGALFVAFWAIMFRCIYRIVEMAGGWGNDIMQDEISFIILDPTLCALAVIVLTIWHPGYCFNYRVVNADVSVAADAEKGNQRPLSEASTWRPRGEASDSREFEMVKKDETANF